MSNGKTFIFMIFMMVLSLITKLRSERSLCHFISNSLPRRDQTKRVRMAKKIAVPETGNSVTIIQAKPNLGHSVLLEVNI